MTNDLCPKCGAYWECECKAPSISYGQPPDNYFDELVIEPHPRTPKLGQGNYAAPIDWERVQQFDTTPTSSIYTDPDDYLLEYKGPA